ncbi:hypothetical protein Asulf_02129 [Archaeoglobus sulfaticallidus PM70-1]|uniref:Uncharacterized protein n=2 Tax=Archaeoglobus TaxID=2233 RepID=N0BP15_9EURY|nr:hypothetical protein Asulf_02129 [Archaeoglobus sulfaticallidus PM70-1]
MGMANRRGNNGNVLNLRIKTDNKFEEKFIKVKEELGLNSNAEVVRYLVNKYYKELLEKGSLLILPIPKILPRIADLINISVDFSMFDVVNLLPGLCLSF